MDGRSPALSRCGVLRLGDVVLLIGERRLTGPSGAAALEPRVAHVLQALGRVEGVPLTRDQLLQQCWGSSMAGEDSLNRTIYQLRKALAKVGSAALSIHTVPAGGY